MSLSIRFTSILYIVCFQAQCNTLSWEEKNKKKQTFHHVFIWCWWHPIDHGRTYKWAIDVSVPFMQRLRNFALKELSIYCPSSSTMIWLVYCSVCFKQFSYSLWFNRHKNHIDKQKIVCIQRRKLLMWENLQKFMPA
jgi:hypothetical protein